MYPFWGRTLEKEMGSLPTYFSMSSIEHVDATSNSSTPRRKVRRHVEEFDATSKSSIRNIEKLDAMVHRLSL